MLSQKSIESLLHYEANFNLLFEVKLLFLIAALAHYTYFHFHIKP